MVDPITILINAVDNATKVLEDVKKAVDDLTNTAPNVKKLNGQLLGIGLSALFAGQALKQVALTGLRSLFTTYNEIVGQTSALLAETNKVTASFNFLKFSITNALIQSPLFAQLISFIVQTTDSISRLLNQFPNLSVGIVVFLALAVAIGTAGIVLGQFATAAASLGIPTMTLLGIAGVAVVAAFAIIIATLAILNSDLPDTVKAFAILAITFGIVTAALFLFDKALAKVFVRFGGRIFIAIAILFTFRNTVVQLFENLGDTLPATVDLIYEAVLLALRGSLTTIIKTLNIAIRAINDAFGTNFKEIGLLDTLDAEIIKVGKRLTDYVTNTLPKNLSALGSALVKDGKNFANDIANLFGYDDIFDDGTTKVSAGQLVVGGQSGGVRTTPTLQEIAAQKSLLSEQQRQENLLQENTAAIQQLNGLFGGTGLAIEQQNFLLEQLNSTTQQNTEATQLNTDQILADLQSIEQRQGSLNTADVERLLRETQGTLDRAPLRLEQLDQFVSPNG